MSRESGRLQAFLIAPVAGVVLGAIIVFLSRGAEGVHIPLLSAVTSGIILGLIEPRKGWIAAIVQSIVLVLGVMWVGRTEDVPEMETYVLIGSVALTFAGSYIGAFMKRAWES